MICYVVLYLDSDNDYDDDNDDNYDNDDDDNALWQGTRVEGDRKGKGTWYPGVISCDRSVSQWPSESVSQCISQCLSEWASQSVSVQVSQLLNYSVSDTFS